MSKARIKRQNASMEFWTSEQCHILEVSNSADDEDVSIARARVEPGVTTRWHRVRDTVERYYILAGEGSVEVGQSPAEPVTAGDVVVIPASCLQRITNTGQSDLLFLAICSPRFRAHNYEEIEPDAPA